MPRTPYWINKYSAPSFLKLWKPLLKILLNLSPLKSKGNRPLKMDFEYQLKALIFFHLEEVRLVGYQAEGKIYWVATDRHDLAAEQVALVYKLRWDIENFFAWWKRHLRVST